MKLLVLSKYSKMGASSRLRMFQYFPYLKEQGIEITSKPLFDDQYLENFYAGKPRWLSALKAYLGRIWFLLSTSSKFDVLWVEKELFPWIPWSLEKWLFRKLETPFVVDYDDAIFHQYDLHRSRIVRLILGKKCDHLMAMAKLVVVGNKYLAERAQASRKSNSSDPVLIIPTVVSSSKYSPKSTPRTSQNSVPIIGWIGTKTTIKYLEKLHLILKEVFKQYPFKLKIVGATLDWKDLPVECLAWEESKEVSMIQSFDIGIMPLENTAWEQGKCGFKLIQYMACGKPVVADPVGANCDIVHPEKNGFLTRPPMTWNTALAKLLQDDDLRSSMGSASSIIFREDYSLERWQGPLCSAIVDCSKIGTDSNPFGFRGVRIFFGL